MPYRDIESMRTAACSTPALLRPHDATTHSFTKAWAALPPLLNPMAAS